MELYFNFLGIEFFQGHHESFIQGLHFVTAVRWEEMMSTCFSQAKVMTSRFLVCEQCPSGTKITGSYFVGFVCQMKRRNHWVKISLCIHPKGWHVRIEPGGVPYISSGFIYFLENTTNRGMKYPVGLIQLTTVTRDPRSAV
jgi:hypothetical protein